MSKRDLGSKLKTRLGEWQAYGGQPVPPQQAQRGHNGHPAGAPPGNDLSEAVVLVSVEETRRPEIPITMEPVHPEEKIAALQAALEHERDQARRLLDVVAREQVLHAVSLKSQTESRFTPGAPSVPAVRKADHRREQSIIVPKASRPNALFILAVLLTSVGGCAYLVYFLLDRLNWHIHW